MRQPLAAPAGPVRLLVNPAAGRGRARRLFPRIARRLDRLRVPFETHVSEGPGHLTALARRLAGDGGWPIVVCGGDGSVNEVLNGLPDDAPPLGIIPCGSGDDIARNLGIPRAATAACALLRSGEPLLVDAVWAGRRRYLGVGGAGLDAEVNRRANATRLHVLPQAIYTWQTLAALRTFRARSFRISADGWRYEGRVMFAVVANAPTYGGGMRISPRSRMDDGLLEVCIVEEMGRLELLANFPRVFRGGHLGHPRFRVASATRVRLESECEEPFYADGEPLASLPLEIRVAPASVNVIGPPPLAGEFLPAPAGPSPAAASAAGA